MSIVFQQRRVRLVFYGYLVIGRDLTSCSPLFSVLSQILAFLCWLGEFYSYLKSNVLPKDDRNLWHSRDLSYFGHSFYFVLIGILFVIINLVILAVVWFMEKKESRPIREDPVDEKTVGAIMLY